jgi:hypothetical protein
MRESSALGSKSNWLFGNPCHPTNGQRDGQADSKRESHRRLRIGVPDHGPVRRQREAERLEVMSMRT